MPAPTRAVSPVFRASSHLESSRPVMRMKAEWNTSGPREWANESFAIAEAARTGYCVNRGTSCDPAVRDLTIGAEYLDANEPVVKEQLQKAGVRLARLLDKAVLN